MLNLLPLDFMTLVVTPNTRAFLNVSELMMLHAEMMTMQMNPEFWDTVYVY